MPVADMQLKTPIEYVAAGFGSSSILLSSDLIAGSNAAVKLLMHDMIMRLCQADYAQESFSAVVNELLKLLDDEDPRQQKLDFTR